jgi:hypothetical protein
VYLYVLEERSFGHRRASATPAAGHYVEDQLHVGTFEDQRTFERGVLEAFTHMHRADVPPDATLDRPDGASPAGLSKHLLVISSHGRERTGTVLTSREGEGVGGLERTIDGHLIDQRLFAIRPRNLVVLLSACWGAYPAFVAAAGAGDFRPPTIVGAIVAVRASDANRLQKDIVSQLCRAGHSEAALLCLVRATNKRLFAHYKTNAFRIVLRSRRSYPREGQALLAAPLLKTRKFMVVAMQRNCATLLGADGKYWLTAAHLLQPPVEVGSCHELVAKVAWQDASFGIGLLCDVTGVTACPRPPGFFRAYKPPFAHCSTASSPSNTLRQMPVEALSTCKRCDWARMANKRTRQGEVTTHHWSLSCAYSGACRLHLRG